MTVEMTMVMDFNVLPTILRNVVPTPTPLLSRFVRTKTELMPVVRLSTFTNSSNCMLRILLVVLLNSSTLVLMSVQTLMTRSMSVLIVVASILSCVYF